MKKNVEMVRSEKKKVKMVNFMLYEFYHNLKNGENELLCNIDEYGTFVSNTVS